MLAGRRRTQLGLATLLAVVVSCVSVAGKRRRAHGSTLLQTPPSLKWAKAKGILPPIKAIDAMRADVAAREKTPEQKHQEMETKTDTLLSVRREAAQSGREKTKVAEIEPSSSRDKAEDTKTRKLRPK